MRNRILNCARIEQISEQELNKEALFKYLQKSKNKENRNNCWFDFSDQVFFGPLEDYSNTRSYDSLYLMQKEEFLNNERHGIPHFVKLSENGYKSDNLVLNEEIIYEQTDFSKSVDKKSVFIIGAGPSSNLINIEEICESYDQVWVCNDYRKHNTIRNVNPTLFYLSNEIYLKQDTVDFLRENKKIVCTMDVNVGRDPRLMNKIKEINEKNNFIFSSY